MLEIFLRVTSAPSLPVPAPAPLAPRRTGGSVVRHRPPAPSRGNPQPGGERDSQEQLALPEVRTGPLLLLLPRRHLFPSSSLSPSDLNLPKPGCASAPERRTRERRVRAVAPRAASKPGPGFFPDPARFSAAVADTVSIYAHLFHPSSTGEKDAGRSGQPPGATRRAALLGAETGGARLCGVGRPCGPRARPSFLPVCPTNLSAEKKSRVVYGFRGGSVIKPRSRSFDTSS